MVLGLTHFFLHLQNLLTASVNEAAYSAIYNKCVKKAVPPVVPINLRHIVFHSHPPFLPNILANSTMYQTNAMVAGWKKDDEWPPAPVPPEPSFSRRRPTRGLARGGPGTGPSAMGGGGGGRRVLGML